MTTDAGGGTAVWTPWRAESGPPVEPEHPDDPPEDDPDASEQGAPSDPVED